jgi:hypothetical protein
MHDYRNVSERSGGGQIYLRSTVLAAQLLLDLGQATWEYNSCRNLQNLHTQKYARPKYLKFYSTAQSCGVPKKLQSSGIWRRTAGYVRTIVLIPSLSSIFSVTRNIHINDADKNFLWNACAYLPGRTTTSDKSIILDFYAGTIPPGIHRNKRFDSDLQFCR